MLPVYFVTHLSGCSLGIRALLRAGPIDQATGLQPTTPVLGCELVLACHKPVPELPHRDRVQGHVDLGRRPLMQRLRGARP